MDDQARAYGLNISARNWSSFVAFVVVAIVCFTYSSTIRLLITAWQETDGYSHGFFLAPISLLLVIRVARGFRPDAHWMPWWIMLLAVFSGVTWLLGSASATQSVQMVSLLLLIYCALLSVYGPSRWQEFVAPVGLLGFSIPIFGFIVPQLKVVTVFIISVWLRWTGRSAYIDGDFVFVRAGTFEIAAGCAGVHYLVVSLTIGFLYSYLNIKAIGVRVIFMGVAAALALVANWVRVFIIITVGDITEMQHYLVTVDHYYFGWFVYTLFLIPLPFIATYLQRVVPCHAFLEALESCLSRWGRSSGDRQRRVAMASSLLLISFVVFPALFAEAVFGRENTRPAYLIDLPETLGGWHRSKLPSGRAAIAPHFVGAESEVTHQYDQDEQRILLYLNHYTKQVQGAELVGYENEWYANEWRVEARSRLVFDVGNVTYRFELEQVRFMSSRYLVAHAYSVGNKIIDKPWLAKVYGGINRLAGKPIGGAVAVMSLCGHDCIQSETNIRNFLLTATGTVVRVISDS